jgi:hypothetical protein
MEASDIGLRAQDIQTCLQSVTLRGLASGKLNMTRMVGMAERLAIHIRGKEVFDHDAVLDMTASELGIDSLILPQILGALEEVNFIQRRGGKIYDRVPYFTSIYDVMGEYWKTKGPNEIEEVSIGLLDDLSKSPVPAIDVRKKYGIPEQDFNIVQQLGREGSYLKSYRSPSDGQDILYSPVFWDEHPEALFAMLRKFSATEIAEAISTVRNYQGYPITDLRKLHPTRHDMIIMEAMSRGILPAPSIDSTAGKKNFVFTPYSGGIMLTVKEREILDKARAILSCVRYGEHFASVTKIRDPAALIDTILSKKTIGPHTEIRQQYFVLSRKGLVRFSPDVLFTDRYYLHLIDNEENMKALNLARDMLVVGEAVTARGLNPHIQKLLFTGTYNEPLTALTERKQEMARSPEDIKALIDSVTDGIRDF